MLLEQWGAQKKKGEEDASLPSELLISNVAGSLLLVTGRMRPGH